MCDDFKFFIFLSMICVLMFEKLKNKVYTSPVVSALILKIHKLITFVCDEGHLPVQGCDSICSDLYCDVYNPELF